MRREAVENWSIKNSTALLQTISEIITYNLGRTHFSSFL